MFNKNKKRNSLQPPPLSVNTLFGSSRHNLLELSLRRRNTPKILKTNLRRAGLRTNALRIPQNVSKDTSGSVCLRKFHASAAKCDRNLAEVDATERLAPTIFSRLWPKYWPNVDRIRTRVGRVFHVCLRGSAFTSPTYAGAPPLSGEVGGRARTGRPCYHNTHPRCTGRRSPATPGRTATKMEEPVTVARKTAPSKLANA